MFSPSFHHPQIRRLEFHTNSQVKKTHAFEAPGGKEASCCCDITSITSTKRQFEHGTDVTWCWYIYILSWDTDYIAIYFDIYFDISWDILECPLERDSNAGRNGWTFTQGKGSELRCRMSREYRHFVQLEALDIFGLWSQVESVWRSPWSPSQTQRRGLFGQVLSFTGIHRYFHLCILQAVETKVEQIGDKLDTLTKKISNVRGLYLSRFLDLPCLACLACLAKLLTAVRSLPFHSHKTWQLHHCWYMIRWDRGCFGGWFTWRQWRQRVFPEVTCMNACSTFPNLQKLPRFLMKRPQNWHRRASQLWNDEQF